MIKMLVVDDDEYILEEICETLTDEGYAPIGVDNVDAALDALRNHADIRLVITDLKMPGKSGADLINESRAEFERNINFIIISGHGSPSAEFFGLDLSQFSFLRKPLDIDAFLASIEAEILNLQD